MKGREGDLFYKFQETEYRKSDDNLFSPDFRREMALRMIQMGYDDLTISKVAVLDLKEVQQIREGLFKQ